MVPDLVGEVAAKAAPYLFRSRVRAVEETAWGEIVGVRRSPALRLEVYRMRLGHKGEADQKAPPGARAGRTRGIDQ